MFRYAHSSCFDVRVLKLLTAVHSRARVTVLDLGSRACFVPVLALLANVTVSLSVSFMSQPHTYAQVWPELLLGAFGVSLSHDSRRVYVHDFPACLSTWPT